MDLRGTAVTEMMEGGVDLAGIMQVTGHKMQRQSNLTWLTHSVVQASTQRLEVSKDEDA